MKKDLPVIALAFILAVALPGSITPEQFPEHMTGIALGFGIAWLLKFLMDWTLLSKTKKEEEK